MSTDEGVWEVECSDEEVDKAFEDTPIGCIPLDGDVMIETCNAVTRCKAGENILVWKCKYGRRPPTPQNETNTPLESETVEESMVDTSGFDFSDDSGSVKLQPRRLHATVTPKGSAKKKTTSFENVLASVYRRQKNMDSSPNKTRYKK